MKSQFVISSLSWGGRRKPPLAFTEQGIAMLSSVLHSSRAVEVNIAIMRTFVQIRAVLLSDKYLEKKILDLEKNMMGNLHLFLRLSVKSSPRKPFLEKE